MIRTEEERKAFYARCQARKAKPDYTVVMVAGEPFTRTRALICPGCGSLFFGYQPEMSEPRQPEVEPQPHRGKGQVATCGHPLCHAEETERVGRNAPSYPVRPGLGMAS